MAAEVAAETGRLAAVAARSAAGGARLGVLETAIRAAFTRLGASLLEDLLALDPGYQGPRAACGSGHLARFVSYRDKVIDTVLGPAPSPAPGTTARPASTGWRPGMPSWGWPGSRCRRGWPR